MRNPLRKSHHPTIRRQNDHSNANRLPYPSGAHQHHPAPYCQKMKKEKAAGMGKLTFEDNAEHGYGIALAIKQMREKPAKKTSWNNHCTTDIPEENKEPFKEWLGKQRRCRRQQSRNTKNPGNPRKQQLSKNESAKAILEEIQDKKRLPHQKKSV